MVWRTPTSMAVAPHGRTGRPTWPTPLSPVGTGGIRCTALPPPAPARAGSISTSVRLTASESQGPILTPEGSGNLWFQTRPGEWVWNPPGDPWPLQVAASDPSGVCSMSAIGWHFTSCPVRRQFRIPRCGSSVRTRRGRRVVARVSTLGITWPAAGLLPLAISATNAAGLSTTDSETLQVDNEPVDVALSTSNDASRTVWANHAVTVFATANAGPSGLGGMNCSSGSSSSTAVHGSRRHGRRRWCAHGRLHGVEQRGGTAGPAEQHDQLDRGAHRRGARRS